MTSLRELLTLAPEEAAPALLGSTLVSEIERGVVSVRITEVEAYKGEDDPASHAYRGRTPRNSSMFSQPGTLYVYRSYGIHRCANTSSGPLGTGWGILIRGGQVVAGAGLAAARRKGRVNELANGPGKLCEALAIDLHHDGLDLLDPASPVRLLPGDPPKVVMRTPRVGISKATDRAWRFVAATEVSTGP